MACGLMTMDDLSDAPEAIAWYREVLADVRRRLNVGEIIVVIKDGQMKRVDLGMVDRMIQTLQDAI